MNKKYKIFMMSDHPLCHSGVGSQSHLLISGLIGTGKYSFRCFGAAIKHSNYNTVVVNEDYIIKPTDGFGTPDMVRHILATEEPDAILLFTDPRFFDWFFSMHDEIHSYGIPILYNTLWDAPPTPKFQKHSVYDTCDALNCISQTSFNMLKEMRPDVTNYIPHFVPEDIFFPLKEEEKKQYKIQLLGEDRKDHFTGLWINRNAKRKRPSDLLWAWKLFLDELEKKHGHKNATLILKTDGKDVEGTDMFAVGEYFNIADNIFFCQEALQPQQMNILHNISDFYINISFAEGFGCGSLQSLQCEIPAIVPLTGGQSDQIINKETKEEHGIALNIDFRTLVGSVNIPYIFEEYSSVENIMKSLLKMYEYGPKKRKQLGKKGREFVLKNFNGKDVIQKWDKSLEYTIRTWQEKRKLWELKEV